jgi:WD40 repeat protein
VKIWDTLKNTLKHDIGPFKDIRCVCFLADSKESLLGFGTADSVVVFDCSRGENYVVLPVTSGAICMCWSEGGSSLFTGHLSGDVLQWSVEDKQLVRKLTVDASPVRCVSVCPNNRYILTASRAVKLWRIRKSKQMNTFKGHIKEVKKLCFIGKDHTHFLSVGEGDRVIQVW